MPLPPGQSLTRRFPVVGERQPPPQALDLAHWRLEVGGLVDRPLSLSLEQVHALPQSERTVDIHCVTGWSRLGSRLQGTPLSALLERASPQPSSRFVHFVAYSERGHDTSLPLELAAADTWLVHSIDGEALSVAHGFPLRTVTPSRYFYKSLKWLHRIELLSEDVLGYWERSSAYHNNADPWPGDERYTSGGTAPAVLARFMAAEDFRAWRSPRRLIRSADLRGWSPRSRVLGAVKLKACDLRGAKLGSVDLSGANLTRCDLRDADLSGAILRGADLEGVDFSGADLREADLSSAALSAARFFTVGSDG
ncbi:MAG: hypothetical protein ACI8S6_004887, partial [Myxococcota bacterium]